MVVQGGGLVGTFNPGLAESLVSQFAQNFSFM